MAKGSLKGSIVLALLLLASSGLAHARHGRDSFSEEFHHTYTLDARGRVSLENVNGDVRVATWDRDEIKIDAVKFARSQDRLADIEIKVDARPEAIHIKTRYPEHLFHDDAGGVDYTLTVPRHARLDHVELVNGGLEIEQLAGDVKASLVNGSVAARELGGRVEISTVNGRLEVTVGSPELAGPVELSSVNGAIVLDLPADINAKLRASTVTGGISNDFEVAVHHNWVVGHNLEGELGRGGAEIRLSDVNGHISIRHSRQVTN